MRTRTRPLAVGAALILACRLATLAMSAEGPDALWRVVHDQCVRDMVRSGHPGPCAEVNMRDGYAVLKDRRGPSQFLLTPTARITGIEDPVLLSVDARNYWADAWRARRFVEARLGRQLPRDAIALAVNSEAGRSQNQLHIHVDCIRADVRVALAAHSEAIDDRWTSFPVPLAGQRYLVRSIGSIDLQGINPFRLLVELPAARQDMGHETLVVVGAVLRHGHPGFYLLADHADLTHGDVGHGESLQDHDCAVARS